MKILERQLVFIMLCLPLRLIIGLLPIYLNKYFKKIYSLLILIVGITFLYLYKNSNLASLILLIDVLIGFMAFLNNHFFKIIL